MNWTDKIQVYNDDCMNIMQQYEDGHFDLAICDPPYGIGEDGRKSASRTEKSDGSIRHGIDPRNGRPIIRKKSKYSAKQWDSKQPEQYYFDELFRVSKKVIIWGSNYLNFEQKTTSSGRIFWDKVNGTNDFSDGEIAFTNLFSSVRQFEFMWNGMLQGAGVNSGRTSQGNKKLCEKRIHPTQKPVALYRWLLDKYAKPDFKILDTHLGSGSNAIACHWFGCELVAAELDEEYYQDSLKRFKRETAQQKMF